jgi:hypothetical protein
VIRPAAPADLPRLTGEWFSHDGAPPHHLLVAEVDGRVEGYATSSPYRRGDVDLPGTFR